MTAKEWYDQPRHLTFKGFKIFYKSNHRPELPALVLLHGFPSCSWDYYKVWKEFSEHFYVISFDFLGFGHSDKPYPHDYCILEQTDLTEAVLEHFGINHYDLIAHDYAVSVAQELLARESLSPSSAVIRRVILLNGGLFPETHRILPIQKILLGPFGSLVSKFMSKRTLQKNFDRIFGPLTKASPSEIDQLWGLLNYNRGKRVFSSLIRYILDRREHRQRWLQALINHTDKILLLNGALDPISGAHLVRRYRELIPRARVEVLENIGHYPNLEAPDKLIQTAKHFFS